MKVWIEAQSQEEFDEKRSELLKALGGSRFDVRASPKVRSRYDSERPATEPREPYFKAQAEILEHFDERFRQMLVDLKREIAEIL